MIKLIKDKYEKKLLSKKWVNGVAIGLKDGKATNKKCIIVTVTEKKDLKDLAKEDIVPKRLLGLFRTDVLEVGELKALNDWKGRYRPGRIGASMMNEKGTACSAGLPVYDEEGNQWTMNNSHCSFCDGAEVGDRVLQPSPADGADREKDWFATTTKYHFKRSPDKENNIDVAFDKNKEKMAHKDVAGREYIPETRHLKESDLGKRIKGSGRTTGEKVGTGILIAIDFTAKIRDGKGGILISKNCAMCLNSDGDGNWIVGAGDSGSPRFIDNRPLVQTFAGSVAVAIFNQTQNSLDWAKEWGKTFTLTKPEEPVEGYIALGNWLFFNGLEITTRYYPNRATLRSSMGLGDNIIRRLPGRTKLKIKEFAGIKDGYIWMRVVL